ncbi:MAG: DUF4012 domain-containing protein [Microgenomates group bacterium]
MKEGMPIALVNGVEKLGGASLVRKLSESDMRVIAVGDYDASLASKSRIIVRSDIPSDLGEIDYVFDFKNEIGLWKKLGPEIRLAIIRINGEPDVNGDELGGSNNWRIVRAHGVVGGAMSFTEENGEVGYLIRAMKLAVRNMNLNLPPRKAVLRLMGEESLVEVVMKATFLAGTRGNIYDIWGDKTDSMSLATWLIEEAKMTRTKVQETMEQPSMPMEKEVLEEWSRLRWMPELDLKNSLFGALQSLFAMADEESRNRKNPKIEILIPKKIVEEEKVNKRRFEVEVEEEEETGSVIQETRNVKLETGMEPIAEEKSTVEEKITLREEDFEIKPILVKNSNSRMARIKDNYEFKITNYEIPKEIKKNTEREIKTKPRFSYKLNISGKWMGIGAAVGLGILLAIIWGLGYGNYKIVKSVLSVGNMIEARKYDEAVTLANKTMKTVLRNQRRVESWQWNRFEWGRHYQEVLKVAEQGLKLEISGVSLAKRADTISEAIFVEKAVNWDEEWVKLKANGEEIEAELAMLSARLAGDWSWIPARWRGNYSDLRSRVEELNKVVVKMTKTVEFMPEMIGTDGKRREYLVLLQNESELRPNGGFIGSYGILSFENGRLLNFEIRDIYEADGQLKGHVEPPVAIKKYLGEANWFMRDANWQANFGESARDLQWFLEKETGRKVDGVIGVDLAVARSILGVTGEIYVPDFKEKINKNNIYEQAEFYAETKFFPGSNQKASFLGGLGRQLFEELKNLKGEERARMVLALIDLLESNDVQMSFNNSGAAKIISGLGWDGAIYEGKCAVDRCFADYLYIVEANLGVNKANYFLYRSIDQQIDIGTQTIGRVIKINYENTSKNDSWPGGSYKNYVRVYIPESANLAEVSVTSNEINGVKTIYSGDSLDVAIKNGKKEVGFLIEVPPTKKKTVELRYVDSVDITNKDNFSYLNYIQRQPGYGDTGIVSMVTVPTDWQVNQVEPAATLNGNKLLFNQKLEKDIKMGVEIAK